MKQMTGKEIEQARIQQGQMRSDRSMGFNGAFRFDRNGVALRVVCSDGEGWDHVSVSIPDDSRCPSWEEMCFIKDLFWDEHEAAMQLHPPRANYVNNHSYCLHLWRPQRENIPLPPSWMVGIKQLGTLV